MENVKRLYRSTNDKVIGGVCGGLADYFNIDVVIIRVAFVLLFLFGGSGVLVYIVLWIAIPSQTTVFNTYEDISEKKNPDPMTSEEKSSNSNGNLIAGIVLILIGGLFLLDRLIPYTDIIDFWPLVLVVVGVILIKPDLLRTTKKIESNIETDKS